MGLTLAPLLNHCLENNVSFTLEYLAGGGFFVQRRERAVTITHGTMEGPKKVQVVLSCLNVVLEIHEFNAKDLWDVGKFFRRMARHFFRQVAPGKKF